MDTIRIIPEKEMHRIPEGLYGFNMEITRKTFWSGLSAQMLNNRKFWMGDEQGPHGWKCEACTYEMNPARSLCESSYVVLRQGGSIAITSEQITFQKNFCYEISIWVNGRLSEAAVISVETGGEVIRFPIVPSADRYVELKTVFKAGADVENGTFRVSLEGGDAVDVYEVSLLPKNHYYGMRRDVIEKLRQLHPSSLRFPGGCCADHFDWKEGLKPVDRRKPYDGREKPFLFRDSFHQDCHDIGIHEFILLCRAVGTQPEYTVRLVLSEAEEARSLVEYCNGGKETVWGSIRESLGFSPFGIRLWYVGNEIYYFGYGLEKDAGEAARKTDAYIAAMKSADPTIETVVGICTQTQYREWSESYIAALKQPYDYISYHRYNGTEIDSAEDDRRLGKDIEHMLMNGNDAGLDYMREKLFADCWDQIRINIDEWNYSWGLKGSTFMLLSNALSLQFMLKNFVKYHIADARFFHPINEGMIDVKPFTSDFDTSGKLFLLYQKHRQGLLLRAEHEDMEIDVLATEHDGNRVCSVINRSEETRQFRIADEKSCAAECILTQMKLLSFSAFDNETEEHIYVRKLSSVFEIPPHSILFLEY